MRFPWGDILNKNCRIAIIFIAKNSIIKNYATLPPASLPPTKDPISMRARLRRGRALNFSMRMVLRARRAVPEECGWLPWSILSCGVGGADWAVRFRCLPELGGVYGGERGESAL